MHSHAGVCQATGKRGGRGRWPELFGDRHIRNAAPPEICGQVSWLAAGGLDQERHQQLDLVGFQRRAGEDIDCILGLPYCRSRLIDTGTVRRRFNWRLKSSRIQASPGT